MAASSQECEIARLLNLNDDDNASYNNEINDYFGQADEEYDSDSSQEMNEETGTTHDDDDDDADHSSVYPVMDFDQLMLQRSDTTTSHTESDVSVSAPKELCNCSLFNGSPCHKQFTDDEIETSQLQIRALTKSEKDIAILAKIECGLHMFKETMKSKQKQTERARTRMDFYHQGRKICRETFLFIHEISKPTFYVLVAYYKAQGIEARIHGNTKRLPSNSLKKDDVSRVVSFIFHYAETHAISLPGRTPHHYNSNVMLLPTNCTKKMVYEAYLTAEQGTAHRIVALRTFRLLWRQLLPFVATMRPATDLCWQCQSGMARINRAANLPLEEKKAAAKALEEHLYIATRERSYLTTVLKDTKNSLPHNLSLGTHEPCSLPATVHYSFDFAQQIMYPSDPLQPGPIYFKVQRKCGIFGVNCESLTRQVNFLIDEAVNTGKGANCVISMLHFFFSKYGLGEKSLHLHADNCGGQNKNSAMIWYLLWRVQTGLHKDIILSFLIAGHTKFSPDCGFGLVKRLFRRTRVNCLDEFAHNVVEKSSIMNISQKCGDELGNMNVPTYDWTGYLSQYYSKVVGIKKLHHIHFNENINGVEVKLYSDSESTIQPIITSSVRPPVGKLPIVIPPAGLPSARQWYLYKEIRQFVDPLYQDIVAPKPSSPEGTEEVPEPDTDTTQPPAKSRKITAASTRGKGKGRGKRSKQ